MSTSPTTSTSRAPARSPDLTTFTVVHRAMRTGAARLAAVVPALADHHDAERVAALPRWYRGFRAELAAHHRVEDELFFPALAERVPSFAAHEERIAHEHQLLDRALDDAGTALGRLASVDGPVGGTDAHAHAVAATRTLSQLLDAHLGLEDADVLPLYVRHFGAEEYAELGQRALKSVPKSALGFAIPWAMDAATGDERARMLREAPLAFRLLWYATRGRHGRLARRALGAVDAAGGSGSAPGPDGREVR